jgi:hypothetical protein
MTTIIAALALGGWGYGGFLDEPSSPMPPAASAPAPQPPEPGPLTRQEPRPPEVPRETVIPKPPAASLTQEPASEPATRPVVVATPVVKPEPARPAVSQLPPVVYRLADSAGQVWEHADPNWLRTFVEERNRSIVIAPAFLPTSCVGGRCPR